MKTIKFRKKEYVVIERCEFDKAISDAALALGICRIYAEYFKEIKTTDVAKYEYMNEIIEHAIQGREYLNTLYRKEV